LGGVWRMWFRGSSGGERMNSRIEVGNEEGNVNVDWKVGAALWTSHDEWTDLESRTQRVERFGT
jgi:hypothetical protein